MSKNSDAAISRARSRRAKAQDQAQSRQFTPRAWPWDSLIIGFVLWLILAAMTGFRVANPYERITVGQRAPVTIAATISFEAPDLVRTEMARDLAAAAVPPAFRVRLEALPNARRTLEKLFARLKQVRALTAESAGQARLMNEALDLMGVGIPAADLLALCPPGQEAELLGALQGALQTVWSIGVIAPEERASRFNGLATSGQVVLVGPDNEPRAPQTLDELRTPQEAVQAAAALIPGPAEMAPSAVGRTVAELLVPWLLPNLNYAPVVTESMRNQARLQAEPMRAHFAPGAILVEAGEVITPAIQEQLRVYAQHLSAQVTRLDQLRQVVGEGVLMLIAMGVAAGLLFLGRKDRLYNPVALLLCMLLVLLALGPAKVVSLSSVGTGWVDPLYWLALTPLGLSVLLAAVLLGAPSAYATGFLASYALAVLFGSDFLILSQGLLLTLGVAHSARGIHRRMRLFRVGIWIGLVQVVGAGLDGLLGALPLERILWQSLAGLGNGMACALLALLLLPVLEKLFGITTDITLLELSDMGHPLLRRLALEAPGTYHHSMMVANLAQAGARAIGANELLVRVCAYYHDIGKLVKPEFFIENAQFRDNPHDDLAPSMSTLVVVSHVKEGVALAQRYKLPGIILDGIQQHHGSGLVAFFYHRARQQQAASQNETDVSAEDFRYPGPKARSPEMAVLSLADCVEAASRSIEKPSPTRIGALVNELIDDRIRDGQLDDADLTLAQLAAVKRAFRFALINMRHGRIAYPKDEDNPQQPTKDRAAKESRPAAPPATPDGPGPTP